MWRCDLLFDNIASKEMESLRNRWGNLDNSVFWLHRAVNVFLGQSWENQKRTRNEGSNIKTERKCAIRKVQQIGSFSNSCSAKKNLIFKNLKSQFLTSLHLWRFRYTKLIEKPSVVLWEKLRNTFSLQKFKLVVTMNCLERGTEATKIINR